MATIDDVYDAVLALQERLAAQVPTDPVLAIPAPSTNQKTIAWAYVWDKSGNPIAGETLRLWLDGGTGHGAYAKDKQTAVSNSDGVAYFEIPRNADLRFSYQRENGPVVRFSGVNSETLELPMVIG